MRVLLIATNKHNRVMSRMNAQPLPIGLAYIAGYLDKERHTLRTLDLMFADDPLAEVESTLREFEPEVVGISIRNLDNQSYLNPQWFLPFTREVVNLIRAHSKAIIVCGGPAFSLFPRPVFSFVEPDLGVAGDAGETFAELVDRLDKGDPYQDLPGLVFRQKEQSDEIVVNGGRCASSFARPPSLEDLDMAKYNQAGFGIGVLTKLGDFYYPTTPADAQAEKSAWRVIRPIDEVVAEVKDLRQRFGMRKVFFIDSGFNLPLAHAKEMCQALIAANLQINWNTALAPHSCDAELISLMKQAGCALVLMGGAGGSSHEGHPPGENLTRLRQICQLCEDGGLRYTISQNFGEPGENRETVEEKLEFLRQISPSVANLRVGVRVLPGSALAQRMIENGAVNSEEELVRPTFYLAPAVEDWLADYLKSEGAQHSRWNLL